MRPLGLSLERIRRVLGEPDSGDELRSVLEALLSEVEVRIEALKGRRDQLRELLSKENPEAPDEMRRAFELAKKCLGEGSGAMIESLERPEGYMEDSLSIQEGFLHYYAEHPEEYRMVLVMVVLVTPIELFFWELLAPWAWLNWLLLLIPGVYAMFWLFGFYASCPHRLKEGGLRSDPAEDAL